MPERLFKEQPKIVISRKTEAASKIPPNKKNIVDALQGSKLFKRAAENNPVEVLDEKVSVKENEPIKEVKVVQNVGPVVPPPPPPISEFNLSGKTNAIAQKADIKKENKVENSKSNADLISELKNRFDKNKEKPIKKIATTETKATLVEQKPVKRVAETIARSEVVKLSQPQKAQDFPSSKEGVVTGKPPIPLRPKNLEVKKPELIKSRSVEESSTKSDKNVLLKRTNSLSEKIGKWEKMIQDAQNQPQEPLTR
jgi:hypothetical protein